MRRRRLSLTALLLLVTVAGGLCWLTFTLLRQDRLDHALVAAIKQNDTKKILALLADGANPNSRDEPPKHRSLLRLLLNRLPGKRPTPSGVPTALLLACSSNEEIGKDYPENPALVKALLERGAALEAKDADQRTPLFWAAARNKTRVCTLLMERGANVNAADTRGITPLMLAARNNNRILVRRLIRKRADVNAVGYTLLGSRLTPLIEAQWTREDDPTVTEMLLSHGAKVNGPDVPVADRTMTPLLAAIENDQYRKVGTLLQHGAQVTSQWSSGESPHVDAKLTGEQKLLQMLQQAAAKEQMRPLSGEPSKNIGAGQ